MHTHSLLRVHLSGDPKRCSYQALTFSDDGLPPVCTLTSAFQTLVAKGDANSRPETVLFMHKQMYLKELRVSALYGRVG